jgi:site-specific recombinase XerD
LIRDSYHAFILSRKSALLSASTIEFYHYTAGKFVDYLIREEILEPSEITSFYVRAYLSEVSSRGFASTTTHVYARGTRAFLSYLNEERDISHDQ